MFKAENAITIPEKNHHVSSNLNRCPMKSPFFTMEIPRSSGNSRLRQAFSSSSISARLHGSGGPGGSNGKRCWSSSTSSPRGVDNNDCTYMHIQYKYTIHIYNTNIYIYIYEYVYAYVYSCIYIYIYMYIIIY